MGGWLMLPVLWWFVAVSILFSFRSEAASLQKLNLDGSKSSPAVLLDRTSCVVTRDGLEIKLWSWNAQELTEFVFKFPAYEAVRSFPVVNLTHDGSSGAKIDYVDNQRSSYTLVPDATLDDASITAQCETVIRRFRADGSTSFSAKCRALRRADVQLPGQASFEIPETRLLCSKN